MKSCVCFWKGIKFAALLGLCGCTSMMASVQYPKPVYLSLSNGQTALIAEKKTSGVMAKYCSGGRQSKRLTFNYLFISPKNPKGWSVSDASSYLKKLSSHRECLNRKLLFSLAEKPDCQTHYGNYVTDLRGNPVCGPANRDESVWFFASDKSTSEIERAAQDLKPNARDDAFVPVLVRSSSGRIYGFHFIGNGSGVPDVLTEARSSFGDNVSSAVLSDLFTLVNEFTIIEPLEFQKQAYDNETDKLPEGAENSCDIKSEYRGEAISFFKNDQWQNIWALGIDDKGESNPSTAINQRARIWKRYISRFSKIKESINPRSSQITITQISLDLNAFCKYGRSLDELTSR